VSPKEQAMLAYYQQRRERKQPANDNDMDEFERQYEADLDVIRKCIDRR
jgi:hypothetical protein